MNKRHKTCCVIPAYNEEDNIYNIVVEAGKYTDLVVVIDDGSTDGTYQAALKAGAIVLKHIINRGQGAALQTGNEAALMAGADIIVHFDADGQFKAGDLETVLAPIKSGKADIVFGSRFLGKESNMPWFKKNIIINIARFINRFFLGIKLTDPQSGFRALSSRAIENMPIVNDGSAHCSEILYKAYHGNFRIAEVPITVTYKDFGQGIFGGKGRGTGGRQIIVDLILNKLIK